MSRAPAQIRRPSSSRRGWPTSRARTTGGTAGERGRSNRIPAFTQLTMLRKTALTQPAGQRSAVGTPTLSLAVKDQVGGEGRLLARDGRGASVASRSRLQEALF